MMQSEHVCGADGWWLQFDPPRVLCRTCLTLYPQIPRYAATATGVAPHTNGDFIKAEDVIDALEAVQQVWVDSGDAMAAFSALRARVRGTGR